MYLCKIKIRKLLSAHKSHVRETSLFTGAKPNPVRNSQTSRFVSVPGQNPERSSRGDSVVLRLQSVLNAAARMIARLPPYSHISDCMFNELHWLPILVRVRYWVLLLVATYKSQQGLAPKYMCELMSKPQSARSSRPLRSADRCDLLIQCTL